MNFGSYNLNKKSLLWSELQYLPSEWQ